MGGIAVRVDTAAVAQHATQRRRRTPPLVQDVEQVPEQVK